jgi:hypothetical protein
VGVGTPATTQRDQALSIGSLDASAALTLLRELGLVTDRDVVAGLVVTDVSRRNRNFRVVTAGGPSFLIKQACDADKARTLDNEASVFEALHCCSSPAVRAWLPPVVRYLREESVLVLGIEADALSLASYHRRTRRFPPGLAVALGRSLAALHAEGDDVRAVMPTVSGLPLVFSFDRPDVTVYYGASSATLQLLQAVHSTGNFADLLGQLRDEWRTGTVVHADLRLDNVVIRPGARARDGKALRLVDWEMAMCGDPAWDVATVLSEYLSLWLDHAPLSGETPPEQFLAHGPFTIEKWQPFVRQFWAAYSRSLVASVDVWRRATRFLAARLVQTAYESTQYSSDFPGQVVLKLQLAHNVLADPEAASRALFGIAA